LSTGVAIIGSRVQFSPSAPLRTARVSRSHAVIR